MWWVLRKTGALQVEHLTSLGGTTLSSHWRCPDPLGQGIVPSRGCILSSAVCAWQLCAWGFVGHRGACSGLQLLPSAGPACCRTRTVIPNLRGHADTLVRPRACAQQSLLQGAKRCSLTHQHGPPGNSSLSYYFMRLLSLAATRLIKIEGNKRNHRGN